MRKLPVWLVAAALLAGCSKKDENTNGRPDNDSTMDMDVADGAPDAGGDASNNGTDAADDAGDMSNLPDGISIPGLTGNVTVQFDDRAVLHVSCDNRDDCFAVQGYYHAAHRFISMELQRRAAKGRLSEAIGALGLENDIAMRTLLSTSDGQPLEDAMWEAAGAETRAGISAYTRGVNAWIFDVNNGRNGATRMDEYGFALLDPEAPIAEWTETDSIANGLMLLELLSNRGDEDLAKGVWWPTLAPETAFDLLGSMSATQVATMPASGEMYTRPNALRSFPQVADLQPTFDRLRPIQSVLDTAHDRLASTKRFLGMGDGPTGSNNWVMGPNVTSSGSPVLANDPHLGLGNPSLWYMVEINAGGADPLHIAGVSLPGLPGVLLGHNENIAWGGTVVFMDLADVYIEELTDDGGSVMFNGQPVAIVEVDHAFPIKGADPEVHTLRFVPHHGPLIAYDPDNGVAISLKWAAHEVGTDIDMFFGLFTASTVDEARTAIANSWSTNQNWVVADRNGDIGWFPFNRVPERPWASLAMPPWLPLPGDGSAEWGEPIPTDELPQMVNPTNGYIVTANTDPTGTTFDGDPTNDPYGYFMSFGEAGGFRQDAIVKRTVAGGTAHDGAMSMDMQGDTYLVLREWVRDPVQTILDANPGVLSADGDEMWATIAAWDGTCPTGLDGKEPDAAATADAAIAAASIGCSAFHVFLTELTLAALQDELEGVSPTALQFRTLSVLLNDPNRLQNGAAYWDDITTMAEVETDIDIIVRAAESASTWLRAEAGATPDEWRWGRLHTADFRAALFSAAGFATYDEGPYAAPGGQHAINVADPRNPDDGDYGFQHGPSMRHVSEFGADGVTSYWTMPGGQRHFRDSPHYADWLDDWLTTTHFQMPFTAEEVSAAAIETVEVVPR